MIIHILLMLIKLSNKEKLPPKPAQRHRESEGGPLVLNCPKCGEISLSKTFILEDEKSGRNRGWQKANEIIKCASCEYPFQLHDLQSDSEGVLHIKQWTCSGCNASTSILRFTCSTCGTRR